jgi:hypothetical protein
MKRTLPLTLSLVFTIFVTAQDAAPGSMQRDENIDHLAADLHTLGRVVAVSKDLGDSRQVLLAITDEDIRTLRSPREDGTYRWAALQREEGGRRTEEATVEQVSTEATLKNVSITADDAYRVLVTVPQKRGVFTTNNRIWVRNVIVDSTGFDGKTAHHEIAVNAWVAPGDATGVALPEIGRSAKATVELGVESGSKKAVAEVALLQAKLVDDPNSPYFPAVKRLLQIRELVAARDMNRGQMRTTIDEALLSLPDELEKRTAAQEEAARARRQMAEMGITSGAIALGDATPDVVRELGEISRLMTGTLEEQTEGRTRMQTLIDTLKPKVAAE